MKQIGIDTNNYLVYEGYSTWGYGLWPSPTLIPAHILSFNEDTLALPDRLDLYKQPYIFIDEGYDPVSRIRKGRIFERYESQTKQWHVHPHPAGDELHDKNESTIQKRLFTFQAFNFHAHLQHKEIIDPYVMLGTNHHYTIWSIVDAETCVSGETILYLKSRKVFGALPKIDYQRIKTAENRAAIKEKIELVAKDLNVAAPDSVVDRCREAASAVLNAYLLENEYLSKGKDLGQLLTTVRESAEKYVVADLAGVLAKLHSRTKHTEKSARGTRSVSEQDAELAVQALGVILIEIEWAVW
ncbi:MAG: hypothetical protein AB2810_18710 [Candidatus Thiodiazotropha endolucinida]